MKRTVRQWQFWPGAVVGLAAAAGVASLIHEWVNGLHVDSVFKGAVLGGVAVVAMFLALFGVSGRSYRSCYRATLVQFGLCPSCGYNLTGNTSGVCPGCGMPTTAGVKA